MSQPDVIITMRFQVEDTGSGLPLAREAANVFGKLTSDYKVKEAALEVVPASDDETEMGIPVEPGYHVA